MSHTVPDVPRAERAHYNGEYEPGRLRRGAVRAVQRLGPHQFRVAGQHEPYYDVNLELDTPCDCPDAQFRGRGCLHELCARLHDGDMKLIQALGDMLLAAEQAREASERQLEKDLRASLKANTRKKKQETAA